MSLNLLYTSVHIKTGDDGKQSFVLFNPRTQKSISFFRSGMARFIEEVYKAKEALNKKDAVQDGIVYHGIIATNKNFLYGISANVYQNRKFIWCRLYVKNEPGEIFGENLNDDMPRSAGVFVKEFDAYATRIGIMLSIHDPFDKLLEMILTVPLESWIPAPGLENDGSSPSAAGFVRSELNQGGFQKKVKSTEIQIEDGALMTQV